MGVVIFYKDLQEVETVSDMVLLGAPMSMQEKDVEIELTKQLMATEKGDNYDGDWQLPFKIEKSYAQGMLYETEEEKKRSKVPALAKNVFIIHVARKHAERMENLLRELKDSKKLHDEYGPTAFTVKVPSYDNQGQEKLKYQQMVNAHISVHMSTGLALIPGIIDLRTKFKFERHPDAHGDREDCLMSLRDVLMLLSIGQGQAKKKIFTAVVQGGSGTVVGIFSSVDQVVKDTITSIRHVMGPQIYYRLIKMGCKRNDIKRFIRKVFSAEQVNNVTLSKYDKQTGLARVIEPQVDDIISAAAALGIDTMLVFRCCVTCEYGLQVKHT
jgi:stress-induced morphogen